MASIAENLRATLLSLKQISDRVKSLILTAVTKSELSTAKQEVLNAIDDIPEPDLSAIAKEATSQEILTAVENIDIDTSDLAKQGTNPNATNTAILAAINTIPDLKVLYSARFEQNQDGQDTYTMVMPIVAGVEESESGHSVIVTL